MLNTLPLALTIHISSAIGVAIIAALSALAVAFYSNATVRANAERQRRRELYSAAIVSVLAWPEYVYRLRRRAPDGSEDRALIQRFHAQQENMTSYQSLLSLESPELGRAYRVFVTAVKKECEEHITTAWGNYGRDPMLPTPKDDKHPDTAAAARAFERDVREHLSRRPWVRRQLKTRYPEERSSEDTTTSAEKAEADNGDTDA